MHDTGDFVHVLPTCNAVRRGTTCYGCNLAHDHFELRAAVQEKRWDRAVTNLEYNEVEHRRALARGQKRSRVQYYLRKAAERGGRVWASRKG